MYAGVAVRPQGHYKTRYTASGGSLADALAGGSKNPVEDGPARR
jgi:hypothetical protein